MGMLTFPQAPPRRIGATLTVAPDWVTVVLAGHDTVSGTSGNTTVTVPE
jgi:hypothetical protein